MLLRENLRGHIIYETWRTAVTAEKTSAISSPFSCALYRNDDTIFDRKDDFLVVDFRAAARLIFRKNVFRNMKNYDVLLRQKFRDFPSARAPTEFRVIVVNVSVLW